MELTEKNFDEFALKSEIPSIIEFWGSWCPPCQVMNLILEKIETEYSGKINVGKVNTDRQPYLAEKYNIRGLPTIILFMKGKEIKRAIGALSEKQLKKEFDLK